MADKTFVDSNIWLYAFISDKSSKHNISADIINNKEIVLSTQVVNEVCYNLYKKADYNNLDIKNLINNFYDIYTIYNINFSTLSIACNIRDKYNSSFWDSLIIASALENECKLLLTEDISGAELFEKKLKVLNPFK
ncbi:MAG: PIN domain-containing protein [Bacteroidetes bacterium]|nr:MAG: PIN domain-containing protein [Bacteroidota bacterium]